MVSDALWIQFLCDSVLCGALLKYLVSRQPFVILWPLRDIMSNTFRFQDIRMRGADLRVPFGVSFPLPIITTIPYHRLSLDTPHYLCN